MGGAYMMQEQYDGAYAALSEALTLKSDDAMLWFNHGMTARYTMRLVESLRDLERAAEIDTEHILDPKLADALAFARSAAESERALRGPSFTLNQLAAQEESFQQAGTQMEQGRWAEAEALFRQVITVADVLPQPWGNLGICLLMQRKFNEAEAALRRALEIDPKYALARQNLAGMPAIRSSGILPQIGITHPLKGSKQHLSVLVEGEKQLRDIR
jgi:tetratricopeptide (TPR) repeat protein